MRTGLENESSRSLISRRLGDHVGHMDDVSRGFFQANEAWKAAFAVRLDLLRMATLLELRRRFQHASDCKFVTAEAYIKHLTGHQALVRSDEPSANLVGLLDRSTGTRFLVPAEELAKSRVMASTLQF